MNYVLIFCIITLLLVNTIKGFLRYGVCQEQKSNISSLNMKKLSGRWYEIVRSNDNPFDQGMCVAMDFKLTTDVKFSFVFSGLLDNKNYSVKLKGDNLNINPLELHISSTLNGSAIERNLLVLDTDYNHYVVFYGCTMESGNKNESIFIFFRTARPQRSKLNQLLKEIQNRFKLSRSDLTFLEHNPLKCKYKPLLYN
jgi:lipocalin